MPAAASSPIRSSSRGSPGRCSRSAPTVCHTDSYLLAGTHPAAAYPVVPGHEIGGVVSAVGSGVTGVREGDVVAVQTLVGCGRCEWCLRGDLGFCDECCELGSSLDG